jgi:hypothetical protein
MDFFFIMVAIKMYYEIDFPNDSVKIYMKNE